MQSSCQTAQPEPSSLPPVLYAVFNNPIEREELWSSWHPREYHGFGPEDTGSRTAKLLARQGLPVRACQLQELLQCDRLKAHVWRTTLEQASLTKYKVERSKVLRVSIKMEISNHQQSISLLPNAIYQVQPLPCSKLSSYRPQRSITATPSAPAVIRSVGVVLRALAHMLSGIRGGGESRTVSSACVDDRSSSRGEPVSNIETWTRSWRLAVTSE